MVTLRRRKGLDESLALVRQGKEGEFVEDACSVGWGRQGSFESVLVSTPSKEGNDSEKLFEHRGRWREFDHGNEGRVVPHSPVLRLPLLSRKTANVLT
jgi:hypothetical protein